jgi:DNA polymerase-3 subunit gamma/tau
MEMDAASAPASVTSVKNRKYWPRRVRPLQSLIIDEVHMLSVNAFNASLKTLEEPPEHVKSSSRRPKSARFL